MPTRAPIFTTKATIRSRAKSTAQHDKASHKSYDAQWRKVRKIKLMANPICEPCFANGLYTTASMVHHVKSIAERPDLRLVIENLQSICRTCHAAIHAKDIRS